MIRRLEKLPSFKFITHIFNKRLADLKKQTFGILIVSAHQIFESGIAELSWLRIFHEVAVIRRLAWSWWI